MEFQQEQNQQLSFRERCRRNRRRRIVRWDRLALLFLTILIPVLLLNIGGEESESDMSTKHVVLANAPKQQNNRISEVVEQFDEEEVHTDPSKSSNQVGNVRRYVYQYFRDKGLTHEAAVGIMANLEHESHFDSKCHQYGGGPGRGIAQWEGGRYSRLCSFANERGVEWYDIDAQLDFLWEELHSVDINQRMKGLTSPEMLYNNGVEPHPDGLEGFKNLRDSEYAVRMFEGAFERSGGNGLSARIREIRKLETMLFK